jgi:hypothetical protein
MVIFQRATLKKTRPGKFNFYAVVNYTTGRIALILVDLGFSMAPGPAECFAWFARAFQPCCFPGRSGTKVSKLREGRTYWTVVLSESFTAT